MIFNCQIRNVTVKGCGLICLSPSWSNTWVVNIVCTELNCSEVNYMNKICMCERITFSSTDTKYNMIHTMYVTKHCGFNNRDRNGYYLPTHWVTNFLCNHKQRAKMGSTTSKWGHLKDGVPQGTLLGHVASLHAY